MTIVLELPNESLGGNANPVRCWESITGLEPEGGYQQVSRWGMPLAAFMIAEQPGSFDAFNQAHPLESSAHEREHAVAHILHRSMARTASGISLCQ